MKEGEGGKSDEIMWKESTVTGSSFQVWINYLFIYLLLLLFQALIEKMFIHGKLILIHYLLSINIKKVT